ncbi:protein S40-4-like [Gastrolobium bilobum]|uniref:protein S40-4-like n=1 Tax=Gastrolobium bilobum TaxID=150636 RepID=UPI002AB0AF66|nr:protein S40-4-like [Gastrolobium bilobum]XP_061342266.1 protein S40-4-like [Gastrolobium bilobum]
MEDKYSLVRQHSEIWKSLRDGDFEEEEIWDVLKNRPDYSSGIHKPKDKEFSPLPAPRPLPTSARMILRDSSSNSSASSSHEAKVLQQSAPVNIPDWSKIYRNNQNKPPKNVSRFDDYDFHHSFDDEDDGDGVVNYGGYSDDNEEEGDEYDSKLPPHEFIARRLARSQISSFSVLEGVGRTLKGRDLNKVRTAVLTKTGFLESR